MKEITLETKIADLLNDYEGMKDILIFLGNNSPTLWVDSLSPIENNLSRVTSRQ